MFGNHTCHYWWGKVCPQVNKFEHILSDNHQMSVAGVEPLPGHHQMSVTEGVGWLLKITKFININDLKFLFFTSNIVMFLLLQQKQAWNLTSKSSKIYCKNYVCTKLKQTFMHGSGSVHNAFDLFRSTNVGLSSIPCYVHAWRSKGCGPI